MLYFSTLKGKPILDVNGRYVGQLIDLTIAPGEKFTEITSFITKIDGEKRKIPAYFVVKYDKQIHLSFPFAKLPILKEDESELSLANDVLDRQIVDTDGLKVVRVNDILLSIKEGIFCVSSVDVGFKGFIRRLGFDNIPYLNRFEEKVLPWEFVAPLEPKQGKIHLNIPKTKLAKIHPADLADIMEDLSHRERAMIFRSLDDVTAAKTLKEAEPEVQKSVARNLKPNKFAKLLETMRPEDAADILLEIPKKNANELLKLIDPKSVENIKELLQYDKETAGGLMQTNYIAISAKATVEEVINYLRNATPSSKDVYYIYVVKGNNVLAGVLPLRNLIIAQPKEKIENIMVTNVITVHPNTKKEDLANLISKYNLLALPVVNKDGELEGVVRTSFVLELTMPKKWKENVSMKVGHIKKKNNGVNISKKKKKVKTHSKK